MSRRGDAKALVLELEGLVDGTGEGRLAVYQDEERELNEKMIPDIGACGWTRSEHFLYICLLSRTAPTLLTG